MKSYFQKKKPFISKWENKDFTFFLSIIYKESHKMNINKNDRWRDKNLSISFRKILLVYFTSHSFNG